MHGSRICHSHAQLKQLQNTAGAYFTTHLRFSCILEALSVIRIGLVGWNEYTVQVYLCSYICSKFSLNGVDYRYMKLDLDQKLKVFLEHMIKSLEKCETLEICVADQLELDMLA